MQTVSCCYGLRDSYLLKHGAATIVRLDSRVKLVIWVIFFVQLSSVLPVYLLTESMMLHQRCVSDEKCYHAIYRKGLIVD